MSPLTSEESDSYYTRQQGSEVTDQKVLGYLHHDELERHPGPAIYAPVTSGVEIPFRTREHHEACIAMRAHSWSAHGESLVCDKTVQLPRQ
jgi:hypothetical protein